MCSLRALVTICCFCFIAWLLSENKKLFSYKIVISGILLQFSIAATLIAVPSIASSLSVLAAGLQAVSDSTNKAIKFCFGNLGDANGSLGFILSLHGFPVLIVISAISVLLTHWQILPLIIKIFSIFFRKTLFVGGTLGVSISANMFTGMSETPLVVKSYLPKLTRSELFSLITCGTTGIAGSVIVLYSVIVEPVLPNSMQHIISSILIGIPAALTFSRIMVPETNMVLTEGQDLSLKKANNSLDAVFIGIIDGGKVMVTIIVMFIGFLSLIDIVNKILANIVLNEIPLSIQFLLGFIFAPIAWAIGIPWTESDIAGSLLGTKFITNELVAYQEFIMVAAKFSEHSKIIMMYALCGFANIGSIGIILGVYNALVPARRSEICNFAFKAVIAGTLANCSTAAIVGLLY